MNASNDDGVNVELNALKAIMKAEADAHNRRGLDRFVGLSPMQMSALMYKPFESPDVLTIPNTVDNAEAPILSLFLLMAERIGEKGVKLTATGNLPRNLCREVAQIHMGEAGYLKYTKYGGLNKETDFYDLHITRLVTSLAKLTRKYHGKVLLTNKAKKLLETEQYGALYMSLFKSFAVEYNWGYWDNYPELRIVQMAFAYHIYGWQRMGKEGLASYELASRFLDAFPMMVDEVMKLESEYVTADPARFIESCYDTRVLFRFAEFLGLVVLDSVEDKDNPRLVSHYEVRAKPLVSQVVVFK